MRNVIIAAALVVAAADLAGAQSNTATGVVFHDHNRNGQRDTGEPGLPEMRVSNGREVTVTDAQGRYRLPVDDDTILFVIKPRDWMTPVDELKLPRFFYVHKPNGSPKGLKFPGVAPTGPLPDSVDFGLYPRPEPDRFDVLMFGDSQPYTIEEVDYFAHDIVAEVIGLPVAFGMSLGDLVGDDLSLFEPLNRTVAHVGVPFYNILGNHDIDFAAATDEHSDEQFEAVYGPPYYSFDYGGVHFIVLDTVMWHGKTEEKKGYYEAGMGEEQLAFVRNDLKHVDKDQLIVLTMHIPLIDVEERFELYKLLAEFPHTVSFSAHWHMHRHWFLGSEDGWPGEKKHHHQTFVTTSGSWWRGAPDEVGIPHTMMRDGGPNGYLLATFDGNDYALRFKAARRPADYQMNVFAPSAVLASETDQTEVVVNVFIGSERCNVQMRVAGGPWQTLVRDVRHDPFYMAMKQAEETDDPPRGRKLPGADKSTHIWVGKLPPDLDVGSHLIEVRTTDMYGQSFDGRRIIRVTPDATGR